MALISVTISGNATPLKKAVDEADGKLSKFGGTAKKFGIAAAAGLAAAGAAAIVVGKQLIAAGEAASTSNARIKQIADSMGLFGDQAGAVTDRLVKLAEATARNTGVDQNAIKLTQAKLLTFGELAKTAGEVGGAFDRATQAAVDLAAAGFGEASGNAVQLGKALQDPIKGMTALNKSGVTFTETEKARIETLVASNKLGDAQALILEAIEKQVGGTAAATANASDKMKVVFSQLQEQLGGALLPIFERFTKFLVDSVFPALRTLGDRFIPPIAAALGKVGDYISDVLVPIFRDRLIPFIQRLGEIIATYVVPIVRDLFMKSFEGLARIFDIVVTKIRENADNIQQYGNYLRDLGKFIVTYVAPVLIKTLGGAFTIVAKLIGPVLDIVFSLMGALGKLGQFLVKIAGFVVSTIGAMINPIIDGMNVAIRGANRLNPFSDIPQIPNLQLSPSIGAAPSAPTSSGAVVQDALDRMSAAAGVPSFSAPDVGLPTISGGGTGGGGGGGGSARTGGGGGGSMFNDFSLGAIDSSFSGDLFSLEALGQRTLQDVTNITVNTVTADANLPTLIVEALQQYNLVNGPADFQIAI
jgi:phage-related protein